MVNHLVKDRDIITTGTDLAVLQEQIAGLRQEIDELTELRNRMSGDEPVERRRGGGTSILSDDDDGGENVYVWGEDSDEAQAFDEFYKAYDEVHAKTRRFLLG